jgi:hypothetical protein
MPDRAAVPDSVHGIEPCPTATFILPRLASSPSTRDTTAPAARPISCKRGRESTGTSNRGIASSGTRAAREAGSRFQEPAAPTGSCTNSGAAAAEGHLAWMDIRSASRLSTTVVRRSRLRTCVSMTSTSRRQQITLASYCGSFLRHGKERPRTLRSVTIRVHRDGSAITTSPLTSAAAETSTADLSARFALISLRRRHRLGT